MPPIFTIEKKEEIKTNLFKAGIEIVKETGFEKLSISRLTKEVGIGKGTFYNFFLSKEQFIYEMISFSKENLYRYINKIIEDKGCIEKEDFLQIFNKFSLQESNNIIFYLKAEDEKWLRDNLPEYYKLDSSNVENITFGIMKYFKDTNEECNPHVVDNIMKLLSLLSLNKEMFLEDAMKETYDFLVKSLCNYIYK